jgi:hypothetical protein
MGSEMSGELNGAHLKVSAPHVIHEAIEGEVIVINLATGTYYSLRGSAAEAWELIKRPEGVRAGQLVSELAARFDAPPSDVRSSFEPFLAELTTEGLVVWANGAPPRGDDPVEVAGGGVSDGKLAFELPRLEKFTDMQELVLLDPVHEVDQVGWPARPDAGVGA